MKSDCWLTPPEIIAALGPFDLDPCAAIEQPWPTAMHHFTRIENGLLRRWWGRVWLNPPYSKIGPWMARLAEHGAGTALLFSRTETKAFFDSIWGRASLLMFLRGRIDFCRVDGVTKFHAPEASVLVAYGEQDADRLAESDLDGALLLCSNDTQVVVGLPAGSWREIIADMFRRHGSEMSLRRLYGLVSEHPRTNDNTHWQAKVRQQVQGPGFERVGRGVYRLRAA